MSLSLNPEQKRTQLSEKRRHRTPWLFFIIFAVLIVLAVFIVKHQKNPKISQNLPINYYLELDLAQFNQVSGLWLENNPNRQKILNFWQENLEKFLPKPPENLFLGQISLIGLDLSAMPKNTQPTKSDVEISQPHPPLKEKAEILFFANISSSQNALNYLKNLGSTQFIKEEEITVLTLKNPIFSENIFYYQIKDKKLIASTSKNSLKLAKELNFRFPQKNFLKSLTINNKFLRIYAQPSKINFLNSFLPHSIQPLWLAAELEPQKLVINLENQDQKIQTIPESWLNFLSQSPDLAFFQQNLNDFIENQPLINQLIPLKDLYSLTKNNQTAFILKAKKTNFSLKPAEYSYCLVVLNEKGLSPNSPEIQKIEQATKNLFAQKFPSEKITFLPDNSTVTEFVAKPEIFEFQDKKIANISLKYLQKPTLEFAYGFFEDKIIFSNAISFLEQVIIPQNLSPSKSSLIDCLNHGNIPSDFVYFNPDSVFQEKYGLKRILITPQKTCIY